jgi:hypothetical protein
MNKLMQIQNELKSPKSQFNKFGGYAYRNAEDILEAVKPLLFKHKCILTITDDISMIGNRIYVKSTARIFDETDSVEATAFAREPEAQKGMSDSQITGAASSYARKYALNGLFAIDDTKDADATNEHKDEVSEGQKAFLIEALDKTKFTEDQKVKAALKIKAIKTLDEFNKIKETIKKS